jgi:CDP-diacylglycerol--serine O-phosphatidyltransferase
VSRAFPPLERLGLANAVTAAGAAFGLGAILAAARGRGPLALTLLAAAIALDRLDGWLARRLGQASDFGRELDSLADAVSFCVAPALITAFAAPAAAGAAAGALYVVAGLWRLAYFNVTGLVGAGAAARFTGVPTTIAASWWLILVAVAGRAAPAALAVLAPAALVALALAMVSAIPFPKHGPWVSSLYLAIPAALVAAWT